MDKLLKIDYATNTHPGLVREYNADYVGVYLPSSKEEQFLAGSVFLVADGVGSAIESRKAGKIAVHHVLKNYFENSFIDPKAQIYASVEKANKKLFSLSNTEKPGGAFATTIVGAIIHKQKLVIASVGDSRAYLIKRKTINQITTDHTLVNHLLKKGAITKLEAKYHPKRNVITRSLGVREEIAIDIFEYDLEVGDKILLCTDGLYRYFEESELLNLSLTKDLNNLADTFIALANDRGGRDNISVCIIAISGMEQK